MFLVLKSILKDCAHTDISHQCLSDGESESGYGVPNFCHSARPAAWRSNGKRLDKLHKLPNLFHHEEGGARRARPISEHSDTELHCWSQRRYALLKVGPKKKRKWQLASTFFQQVFACVDICSHPHPVETKLKPWLVGSQHFWQAGWRWVTLVYLALVVLIGLVNRIFHKRSDGLEQFLFGVGKGMHSFRSFKGDFCTAGPQQPNSFFCLPALFVPVFLVQMHFVPRRPLIPSFVLLSLQDASGFERSFGCCKEFNYRA